MPTARQARPQVESPPESGPEDRPEATGDTGKPQTPAGGTPLPALPTSKTTTSGVLEEKTTLLYGPSGIGKSTLASQWAGGEMLFLDTAGELSEFLIYRLPVTDWTSFRSCCAAYVQGQAETPRRYAGLVIDTADLLTVYCQRHIRAALGVQHESDAEWGKGYDALKGEMRSHLAKLAALPGGLVLISHSRDREIKKRNEKYDRQVPTLSGGIEQVVVDMADLVLFIDWSDEVEGQEAFRVIKTKPGKYHVAKERGATVRLPDEIAWPTGESGWEVLSNAWKGA